jgi:hypothetical protein
MYQLSVYVWISARVFLCVCVYVCTCVSACLYVYLRMHFCVCVYVCQCVFRYGVSTSVGVPGVCYVCMSANVFACMCVVCKFVLLSVDVSEDLCVRIFAGMCVCVLCACLK